MLTTALLFAAGLGVGTLGTLIGAGGGCMIVPLLLFGLHFTPQKAVGTSLSVVFLNALSGSIAYMIQRRVLYRMGLAFAIVTIPGALLGATLVQYLGSRWFTFLFALFLLALAGLLHKGQTVGGAALRNPTSAELGSLNSPVMRLGMVLSFLVGIISSLFGIGGGIVHVPFLIVILGLPVHAATATSHFVLAITSLAGTLIFLRNGQVVLHVAAVMGVGVLLGAQAGAKLSTRMRSEPIRRVLALAVSAFALVLLFRHVIG
ncbi:MAG: sulfite exporter TauE/SafE family protein [Deltaproteobacteria bacterium]|nr:sulfite exporter TauE/SafE family protein [Deltaproteobacteria bacterium]